MSTPDERTRSLVARIAERRAIGWRVLIDAFSPPTNESVASLCEGLTHATIVHATAWLESDRDRFDPDLALLDAYRWQACSRPTEEVVRALVAEHTRLFVDGVAAQIEHDRLVGHLVAVEAMVHEERGAWAAADFEGAKSLRAVQQEYLLAHLATSVPALCDQIAGASGLDLYRGWAGLLRTYLSIESGVDYGRTVLRTRSSPGRSATP